jgi:hypothetical protein
LTQFADVTKANAPASSTAGFVKVQDPFQASSVDQRRVGEIDDDVRDTPVEVLIDVVV